MPVHDWTKVDAGIFHDFHMTWLIELKNALNEGRLPRNYYAMAEQHAGRYIADVLTLHIENPGDGDDLQRDREGGGLALAEAPPNVRRKLTAPPATKALRRTLTIRHVSGHRLVALVEIASPANKDRAKTVADFAAKVEDALRLSVHVLMVDLFPPGRHDPFGLHGAIWQLFDPSEEQEAQEKPLTTASYVAAPDLDAYLQHFAVGEPLPEMPLFLRPDRYVPTPLEESYQQAFRGVPAFWREKLELRAE